jgi:uncharacterized protein
VNGAMRTTRITNNRKDLQLFFFKKPKLSYRDVVNPTFKCITSSANTENKVLNLKITLAQSITTDVSESEWNACCAGSQANPFLSWAFLSALEQSNSAIPSQGWLPQHILARDESNGELLGCMPLYLKGHSYGEYVFDNAWANAYLQYTMKDYYPKLQSCVPFSPVPGPRLLAKHGPQTGAVKGALARALRAVADELKVSSAHMTFNTQEEWEMMGPEGYLQRTGIQYHWKNRGYTSFDDFLMVLKQSKRKNIRQERKKVREQGIKTRRLIGSEITAQHWDFFYDVYLNTTDRKWGQAYLTREFFYKLGELMGDNVLLVTAYDGPTTTTTTSGNNSRPIAAALNIVGSDSLYGRNWGCVLGDAVPFLHFELCYYQAIEHAIEAGLATVEAGAQGEHKIARGYEPVLTYSSHYIPEPEFRRAVARFLDNERDQMEYTLQVINQQASPYKEG